VPADRQLSRNFWLSEFRGWEQATAAQVERLQETVDRVLQPIRDVFGRVVPSSWTRWSSGEPRTGTHAEGGTVDFITLDADLEGDVFPWGRAELLPAGYLGRWIYEPDRSGPTGTLVQRKHIHAAPRADMLEAFGIGDVAAFTESTEGVYLYAGGSWDGVSGAYGDPIPLPGFIVSVDPNPLKWALAAAGAFIVLRGDNMLSIE
jgi:hypothetical protein